MDAARSGLGICQGCYDAMTVTLVDEPEDFDTLINEATLAGQALTARKTQARKRK